MKLQYPIEIDVKEFFLHGKFDFVTIGADKEWLKTNFADPDNGDWNVGKKKDILLFGSIEFHFIDDKLTAIFSDKFTDFTGGKSIHVNNLWIISDEENRTFNNVTRKLHTEKVDYQLIHDRAATIDELHILSSGVKLVFENDCFKAFNLTGTKK